MSIPVSRLCLLMGFLRSFVRPYALSVLITAPPRLRVLLCRVLAALSVVACQLAAAQSHLDYPAVLDAVGIDKQTGTVTFVLLVDVPLDELETLRKAEVKLNRYWKAIRRGWFYVQNPTANPALPVKLHVFHLPVANDRGAAALQRLERSSRRYGFQPTFEARKSIFSPASKRGA